MVTVGKYTMHGSGPGVLEKKNTSEDGEGGDVFVFSSPITLVGIFRGSYGSTIWRAKENKTD